MTTTVVLFTRDLRIYDHPALDAAVRKGSVVPLFVFDDDALAIYGVPNRVRFLLEAVTDLRESMRSCGGDLWIRRGDPATEAARLVRDVDAAAIHVTSDASSFARTRLRRLRTMTDVTIETFEGVAIVEPGTLTPASGDHYKVFTPYSRAWLAARKRTPLDAPARIESPSLPDVGSMPELRQLIEGPFSPDLPLGGEKAGRDRAAKWLADGVERYAECRDDLAIDATSRLSPYLHLGCISALELMKETPEGPGGAEFVRQLCWRDFFLQVLAATPDYPRVDYRPRLESWTVDDEGLARWKEGRTGVPIVDAGMRQLAAEGWMHNRARLITASYLTRTMNVDWRAGAQHFWELLVDGDVASNAGNWQWVAGTGNATRRGNAMNPIRQAKRFDKNADYVRRYVPELAHLETAGIHEPWRLPEPDKAALDYPIHSQPPG